MKMNRYVGVGALLVLLAGAAFAIAPFVNQQKDPWRFNQTVTVIGRTFADGGITIGNLGAHIPNSYTATRDWDFLIVGAGNAMCQPTAAVTVTGARFGDNCFISNNFGSDGGAGPNSEIRWDCWVSAANAVTGRACAPTDGGAIDLADAGYFFRTIGH